MRSVSVISALTTLALLTGCLSAQSAAAQTTATIPNFRVGIQLADNHGDSGAGVERFTRFVNFGGGSSEFAGDSDSYDPDAIRIDLNAAPAGALGQVDFRIGGQGSDLGSHFGPIQFTPWASEGGGLSSLITDDDSYDPDAYRLFIETRPWPLPFPLNDFRFTIEAVDGGVSGVPMVTPWASSGGGMSQYALDSDGYDLDGFRIGIEDF